MRTIRTLALTSSLMLAASLVSSVAMAKAPAKKKKAEAMINCPFMHKKVAKSKAIKVTADNGKSMYVCCKGCEEPAKKQLMAGK